MKKHLLICKAMKVQVAQSNSSCVMIAYDARDFIYLFNDRSAIICARWTHKKLNYYY